MYEFNPLQSQNVIPLSAAMIHGVGSQQVVPTEPPLSLELGYLINNVADLEVAFGDLVKRLNPLMMPEPPGAANGGTEKGNTRGAVVDALAANNTRLRLLRDRVSALQAALVV